MYLLRFKLKVLMEPIILIFIKLMGAAISGHCHPWISWDIHPLGGFRRPSLASRTKMAPAETPDIIMTLVSYFCGLPGVPRKACKHWHYRASFALKVTICWNNVTPLFADAARQNMLACVFTVANVLGTCHWYHCSLLIYRLGPGRQRDSVRVYLRRSLQSFQLHNANPRFNCFGL